MGSMRSSGLLLPISALPGGRLGKDAFRFVDFLAEAGQRWWQLLPIGPPGLGGSPYSALSAFAGNEAWIEADQKPVDPRWRRRNACWIEDYARFRNRRDPGRVVAAQQAFDRQWMELKRYANQRGVGLIGDLAFFCARKSADVWANPGLFKLTKTGAPKVVAGVPPDYFSKTGQRWGHPHYDWAAHKRQRFRWWAARAKRAFELFDMVRMDHFLGIARAWEVPGRARTARRGRWIKGPGRALLKAILLGPMIAEDLGVKNPEADALREEFGLPGMRVLQFSFGPDPAARPHDFPKNCVVYTGTHDNDTTLGWYRRAGADGERARRYAGCTARQIAWGMIRVAQLSPAKLAIVPVQDLLGLDGRARLNRPGTTRGNWSWRLRRGQLRKTHAKKLRELTEVAGR